MKCDSRQYLPTEAESSGPSTVNNNQSEVSVPWKERVGWFRAMRSREAMELLKKNPRAFIIAFVIAYRGQWSDTFNQYNLALGEALLGDFENYGMTRQQYRTALAQLEKWGFATVRTTSQGTIAKLTDARLFSISRLESNHQRNQPTTIKQPSSSHQATTTEISTKDKNEKEEEERPPGVRKISGAERISFEKERALIAERLKDVRLSAGQDAWGKAHYTPEQRDLLRKLKARDEELRKQLGSML